MSKYVKQQQMTLFGGTSALDPKVAAAVKIVPRYVYKREKGKDGKWHVVRDANDNPIPLVNEATGEKVVSSLRIGLLPRKSEDNPDLAGLTGLSGQSLMTFEKEARDVVLDDRLAHFQRLRATGQYTFGSEIKHERSGAYTLTIKPVFGGRSVVTSTDEELLKEMERRGFKVDRPPSKDNTEPKQLPAETKPKSGKSKPVKAA